LKAVGVEKLLMKEETDSKVCAAECIWIRCCAAVAALRGYLVIWEHAGGPAAEFMRTENGGMLWMADSVPEGSHTVLESQVALDAQTSNAAVSRKRIL
jgi:hypothetical protein